VARNTGSPFADIVCWTRQTSGSQVFSNIVIKDCVLEVCDLANIDLADYRAGAISGPVHITGCTLKGSELNTFVVEGPQHIELDHSFIGRSTSDCLAVSTHGYDETGYVYANIHDNVIDTKTANGVADSTDQYGAIVILSGGGVTFADNTTNGYGRRRMLQMGDYLRHSTVTGNEFYDYMTSGSSYALTYAHCDNVVATGNTFSRNSGTNATFYNGGGNTNMTMSNTFTHF
jgi:hypothetical protein